MDLCGWSDRRLLCVSVYAWTAMSSDLLKQVSRLVKAFGYRDLLFEVNEILRAYRDRK